MENFINLSPTIALIFFFSVFAVIIFLTYRPSAKKFYQKQAYTPIDHEERNR